MIVTPPSSRFCPWLRLRPPHYHLPAMSRQRQIFEWAADVPWLSEVTDRTTRRDSASHRSLEPRRCQFRVADGVLN